MFKCLTIALALVGSSLAAPLHSRTGYAEIKYISANGNCREIYSARSGPSGFSEELTCAGPCDFDALKAKYGERLTVDYNQQFPTATLPFGGPADYTCSGTPGPVQDTSNNGYDATKDPQCQATVGGPVYFGMSGWIPMKHATLDSWVVVKQTDTKTVGCQSHDSVNCIWVGSYACAQQLASSADGTTPYLDSSFHQSLYGITGDEDSNHWIHKAKVFFNIY